MALNNMPCPKCINGKIQKQVPCKSCNGTGWADFSKGKRCTQLGCVNGFVTISEPCFTCKGTGSIPGKITPF